MERHLISNARAQATVWLRRTHGWIGLWGATLGLLFGVSGIWLNHRSVLPLQPAMERANTQLALPEPRPADPAAMAAWLQSSLALPRPAASVRVDRARAVPWAEDPAASGAALQPALWTFNFGTPKSRIQAEYWVGNRSVNVRRIDAGVLATLTNLHKGIGMPVPWILLVDTLAGSMILLSLSGLALWLLTRRRRALGLVVLAAASAATAGLALAHL
jgi:uncharacterized protein